MAKISNFDKKNLKAVDEEIRGALQVVASRFGLKVELKGGSFTDTTFTPKIEFAVVSGNGIAMTKEAQNIEHFGYRVGLTMKDLGVEIELRHKKYKIVGMRDLRFRPKQPIVVECVDNSSDKLYVDVWTVLAKLNRSQDLNRYDKEFKGFTMNRNAALLS